MIKICSAEQMRNIDVAAINSGISGIVLMENAAMRCVEAIEREFQSVDGLKIGVFCGKGNNGGDGFAIARQLDRLGAVVTIYTVCGTDFSGDALINFNMLEGTGCTVCENLDFLEYEIPLFNVVVDAILGTGIVGDVRDNIAYVIERINAHAAFVLSVDVPSGINSDTGDVAGLCIRANRTVTFAAYKWGLLSFPGADFAGEISVANICIPDSFFCDINRFIIDRDFVREHFPEHRNNSHKGDYGKVLIIAGSRGMTGAAFMAAEAANFTGSGTVTVAVCDELVPILEAKTTEAMTVGLKSENGHLSEECIPKLLELLPKYDAVLFGPGLGRSDALIEILKAVAGASIVPLVIDADGLFALSQDISILEECTCSVILTPHEMEMSRLIESDVNYVSANRADVSRAYAEENGLTLILKGHRTIVTFPDGSQYINIAGNSGMATGGSGDILAGITVSLAAREIDENKAAAMAVYIHAAAGDLSYEKFGKDGVTAMRIGNEISGAIKNILR